MAQVKGKITAYIYNSKKGFVRFAQEDVDKLKIYDESGEIIDGKHLWQIFNHSLTSSGKSYLKSLANYACLKAYNSPDKKTRKEVTMRVIFGTTINEKLVNEEAFQMVVITNLKQSDKKVQEKIKEDTKPKDGMIHIVCYGKETKHKPEERKKLIEFYTEGIFTSEGSERDRYVAVVAKLREGKFYITDDE